MKAEGTSAKIWVIKINACLHYVHIKLIIQLRYDICILCFKEFYSINFFSKNKHEKLNLHSCKKEEKKEENNLFQNKVLFFF